MGDKSGHLRKISHNNNFFKLVLKNDPLTNPIYPDWMVTIIFYTALHHVDAKLSELDIHPDTHPDRNSFVAYHLKQVCKDYLFLKSRSEYARYITDSEKKMSALYVQECVNCLKRIKQSL